MLVLLAIDCDLTRRRRLTKATSVQKSHHPLIHVLIAGEHGLPTITQISAQEAEKPKDYATKSRVQGRRQQRKPG